MHMPGQARDEGVPPACRRPMARLVARPDLACGGRALFYRTVAHMLLASQSQRPRLRPQSLACRHARARSPFHLHRDMHASITSRARAAALAVRAFPLPCWPSSRVIGHWPEGGARQDVALGRREVSMPHAAHPVPASQPKACAVREAHTYTHTYRARRKHGRVSGRGVCELYLDAVGAGAVAARPHPHPPAPCAPPTEPRRGAFGLRRATVGAHDSADATGAVWRAPVPNGPGDSPGARAPARYSTPTHSAPPDIKVL